MQKVYIEIPGDDLNPYLKYMYLVSYYDNMAQFARDNHMVEEEIRCTTIRDIANIGLRETKRNIYRKYLANLRPVRWGNSESINHIMVFIPDDVEINLAICKRYVIPDQPGYGDYIQRLFGVKCPIDDELTLRPCTATIQVTEDCNLRCSYCYQINKTHNNISLETAISFVDALLDEEIPYCNTYTSCGLVLEFIGGEPFMEIELIDKVTEHLLKEALRRNHPWMSFIRISISTNGVLFNDPRVQEYVKKYRYWLSLGVSWNGGPDKLNIRNCFISADGELQLRKGVSLTEEEVDALTDILVERRKHGLPKTTKDGKKAVNFNDIFDATTEIVERRDAGYTTEDGFIKLRTKPGVKINGG